MKKFSKCMALLATLSLLSSLFFSCKQEPDVPVVTEISVNLKEQGKIFVEGDALSKEDVVVTALYSDGKTIDVTNRVKFSPELPLTLTAPSFTLVAEYDEKKAELKIDVGQKNDYYKNGAGEYIKLKEISLALKDSNKEFFEGDAISKDDFVVTAKYEDDTTKEVKESDGVTFEGITDETLTVGEKTIKATFGSQSKEYKITVHKKGATVESISITLNAGKTYIEGETIYASDFTVTAKFSDDTSVDVTNKAEFTGLGKTTAAGKVIITATYESKTGSCEVEVQAKTLTSVSLSLKQSGKTFEVGETISSSDFTVTATYNNGTTEDVTDKAQFAGLGKQTKFGKVTITATYETKSASLDVTVRSSDATVTSITLKQKSGKTFFVGDTISKSDFIVTAIYSDTFEDDVTNKAAFEGLENATAKAGKVTIKATYQGKSDTCDITVEAKPDEEKKVVRIWLELAEQGRTFVVGETISESDFIVTAIYDDGSTEDVTNKAEFTGLGEMTSAGRFTIEVTYKSLSDSIGIVVRAIDAELESISLALKDPERTFFVGETIYPNDFMVIATYSDGFEEDVTWAAEFEGLGKMSKAGEITITATYSTKTASIAVFVESPNEPETLYVWGNFSENLWSYEPMTKNGNCFFYEFKETGTIPFCITTSTSKNALIFKGGMIPQTGVYVELRLDNDGRIEDATVDVENTGDKIYVRYEEGLYYVRYAANGELVEPNEEMEVVEGILFDIYSCVDDGDWKKNWPEYMLEDENLRAVVVSYSESAIFDYTHQWYCYKDGISTEDSLVSGATSERSPNFEEGYFYYCVVTATARENSRNIVKKKSPVFYICNRNMDDVSLSETSIDLNYPEITKNLCVNIDSLDYCDSIKWKSSDAFVVVLDGYTNAFERKTDVVTLRANGNGEATITVTVTRRGVERSFTCTVTVNGLKEVETEKYSWWYSVLDTSDSISYQTINLIFNNPNEYNPKNPGGDCKTLDLEKVQSKGEIFYKWNGYDNELIAEVDKSNVDKSILQEADTVNKLVVYVCIPDKYSSVNLYAWDVTNTFLNLPKVWPGVKMQKCK